MAIIIKEPDFKKGEWVHVIKTEPLPGKDIAPPLMIGEEKQIFSVYVCHCGQDHVNVGLMSRYNFVTCYNCDMDLPNSLHVHWCHPSRFERNL